MAYQQTRSFTISRIAIFGRNNKSYDITKLCTNFYYIEDIQKPYLQGALKVIDSAGLLNLLPISGGEKVEIELEDGNSQQQGEKITYNLTVWSVKDRSMRGKAQGYALGLISEEALTNEVARVQKTLKDKPEAIIDKLLKEDLLSKKEYFSEESQFSVIFNGGKRRPFDIGGILAQRSIPKTATIPTSTSSSSSTSSNNVTNIKGSAGYYFWESRKGFNFYSVDGLLKEDEDRPPWGPYVERVANVDDSDDRFKIIKCNFKSEIDILTNLRGGKYSSLMVFFNPSTGNYSEYKYSLQDSYQNMSHLGSAGLSKVPASEKELSEFPTKIISEILDHETWFTGGEIASIDENDGGQQPTPYADWQKYFFAQSIARYESMKNQECVITIPGNTLICAGDKIDIVLRNKIPNDKEKEEPDDNESSGIYLIKTVTHSFSLTTGIQGDFTTTLQLIRDSYGKLDTTSAHDSE
jgi:hypothetical protein